MGAVLYPRLNRGLDFPRESMVAKQGAETKQSSPKQTNKSWARLHTGVSVATRDCPRECAGFGPRP